MAPKKNTTIARKPFNIARVNQVISRSWIGLLSLCLIIIFPAFGTEQTVKQGGTGILHTGSGDINISGYTIEQYEQALKVREGAVRAELKKLHHSQTRVLSLEKQNLALEKQRLETELAAIQGKQQDLEKSYKERIRFLEATISELRAVAGTDDDQQLQAAIAALQRGETDQADRLFQQIEEREQASIERAAKAAFERGKIAEANIDYHNAYRHFARAVGLSPENPEYLDYAGFMAGILAKHQKEVEWKE